MSLEVILVFAATEFVLSLTPGPAVLVVVSQGMRHGFAASARGAAGILAGNAVYFALSALGLGALLLASATLFAVLKWAGVAYLVFVGLRMLLAKGDAGGEAGGAAQPPAPKRSLRLFSQGLLTQLSNPKALVFFTALLPQFVSPEGRVFEQFLLLGVVSITVECPVLLAYGWLAERGQRLLPKGRLSTLPDRIAGAFLIGAGLGLAALRR
ncbi:MAG TPA: LysE family translocator [Pyrinomonadaceae bacterium]